MKRTLRLRREVLTELADDELMNIVGGDSTVLTVNFTCPLVSCVVCPTGLTCLSCGPENS